MKKLAKKLLIMAVLVFGLLIPASSQEAQAAKKIVNMPMFENKYMAHAFSRYNGKGYQNTKEAFLNAINQGYKYLETDLSLTSDGKVVCSHGWTKSACKATGMTYKSSFKNMTRAMFLKQKVNGCTTLDARGLYKLLKKYPDVYIELDLKASDWKTAKKIMKQFIKDCKKDASVLDRCLVQVGTYKTYREINKLYKFKYYQMITLKGKTVAQFEKVAKFCKKNKIGAIALNKSDCTKKNIALFKKYGMYILAYSTDSKSKAKKLFDLGVDTICTGKLK